eukprot:1883292-Rhodomonas_salina.1
MRRSTTAPSRSMRRSASPVYAPASSDAARPSRTATASAPYCSRSFLSCSPSCSPSIRPPPALRAAWRCSAGAPRGSGGRRTPDSTSPPPRSAPSVPSATSAGPGRTTLSTVIDTISSPAPPRAVFCCSSTLDNDDDDEAKPSAARRASSQAPGAELEPQASVSLSRAGA